MNTADDLFYNVILTAVIETDGVLKQLRLKASAVLNSLRSFNLASEKHLLKGAFNLASEKRLIKDACRIEVKKCDPRGGGYSDIFEQHRLRLFWGFRFKSIFFGSGDILGNTSKYSRVGMSKKNPKK